MYFFIILTAPSPHQWITHQETPRSLLPGQGHPQQQQGPALPSGPPLDIDNLDTLPDDLELLKDATPLPEPPEGFKYFDFIPQTSVWQDSKDLVFEGDIIPFYVQRKFKKLLQQALREIDGYRGIYFRTISVI